VVANLGDAAVSRVAISSAAAALPVGRYTVRNLLGGPNGATLTVRADGQVKGYVPARGSLGPRTALVLYLSSTTAP